MGSPSIPIPDINTQCSYLRSRSLILLVSVNGPLNNLFGTRYLSLTTRLQQLSTFTLSVAFLVFVSFLLVFGCFLVAPSLIFVATTNHSNITLATRTYVKDIVNCDGQRIKWREASQTRE